MKRFTAWLWRKRLAELAPAICPEPLALPSGRRILVIAPHCDDETLGCGGTLALLARNQCTIRVVVLTNSNGGEAVAGKDAANITRTRRAESKAALGVLGVEDVVFLDEPDGALSLSPRFMAATAALVDEFQPDWLFVPSIHDYHRDHVAAGLALLSIWGQRRSSSRLFLYEIWSPLPATGIVDITEVMTLKRQALGCYATALRYGSYLSSAEGLAIYRGLNVAGPETRYVEAFAEIVAGGAGARMVNALLQLRLFLERLLTSKH
jgi:LmbE family N-acetylglucosaminyl deacetylase